MNEIETLISLNIAQIILLIAIWTYLIFSDNDDS